MTNEMIGKPIDSTTRDIAGESIANESDTLRLEPTVELMGEVHVSPLTNRNTDGEKACPQRILQLGVPMAGKSFELLYNFNEKGDFYFVDDRSADGLRYAFDNYPSGICDSIVFENLGSPRSGKFHLPYREFEKLTDTKKETYRGRRVNWSSVWFCSKLPLEKLYPNEPAEELYERIDTIVFHYLHADASWRYIVVSEFDAGNMSWEKLESLALSVDPGAIFSLAEIGDVPDNRDFAAGRFNTLGLRFHRDASGFVIEEPPQPVYQDTQLHYDSVSDELVAMSVYSPDSRIFLLEIFGDGGESGKYVLFDMALDDRDTARGRIASLESAKELVHSEFADKHDRSRIRGEKMPEGISLDLTAPTCRRWLPGDFE